PWNLRKDPDNAKQLQDVCTVAMNLLRQLANYLAPVLPRLAEQAGELLGRPLDGWNASQQPLVGTPVAKFTHMMQRIERKDVDAMIEEGKQEAAAAAEAS
ncbi:MAG: methionine--tRNA ligase, partial [Planctomycetales bacterium]|nr:methionine--tRNA ligase [Planctomycetales bacterium]